jgi:ribosomal protein L17
LYEKLKSLAKEQQKEPAAVVEQLITMAYQQQIQASTPAFQNILENAVDLGVTGLAEQHDHYLHGVAKR